MFGRENLDALFDELNRDWRGKPEYEQLIRDAHLGIAQFDAGRPLSGDLSPIVVALIEKHKPRE